MKYALSMHMAAMRTNIGDAAMTLGLAEIYRQMGVSPVVVTDPWGYESEACVYPFTYPITEGQNRYGELSPNILPVFMGTPTYDYVGLRYMKETLAKNYKLPILCRDKHTERLFIRHGLNAFFIGCVSMALPKRDTSPVYGKILACDAPEEVLELMPTDLKERLVILPSNDEENYKEALAISPDKWALHLMKMCEEKLAILKEAAALVVTKRYHIALPCLAMGIPVIFTLEDMAPDMRCSMIEHLVPVYTAKNYEKINWSPPTPDCEEIKHDQMKIYSEVITAVAKEENRSEEISKLCESFQNKYLKKEITPYRFLLHGAGGYTLKPLIADGKAGLFERLTGRRIEEVDFVFYGAGNVAGHYFAVMKKLIDAAKSFNVVDGNPYWHGKKFFGYEVSRPEEISLLDKENLVVFIVVNGFMSKNGHHGPAFAISDRLSSEFGLTEGEHYFIAEKIQYGLLAEGFYGEGQAKDTVSSGFLFEAQETWDLITNKK